MGQYTAPLRDMQFVLHELLDVASELQQLPKHADIDAGTINQVLEEAGKFASKVVFPLNRSGDREGCHFDRDTHAVTTPHGFREAYRQYVEAGWPALSCDVEYGGQGLPVLMSNCLFEMLNAANQAWTMYTGLSHGAYECLRAHGTPEEKALYLPRLVSGEWTGTMCLTESHCGTDLGLLRTRAEPQTDGSYMLTGAKIFISAGEHDMTTNIIHLVLARLPDAPKGTHGISLFLVPKFIPNADGSLGARNAISCGGIEEKMGIHANATCQMNLDGATGWLIGAPHKGLNAMFVMMNAARLGVGMQSLGLGEVAYQNAVTYAKDRIQMRSLSGVKAPDKPADPIIVHPDVRRMLLTARAYAEGGRAFASYLALLIDKEHAHPDPAVRQESADLVALLTPVAKAFLTENGWISTSESLQVYGGHGFICEWGMEQYLRDSRINMIYEGTNTVQALDLLGRKILLDGGAKLMKFGALIQGFVVDSAGDTALAEFIGPLDSLVRMVGDLTAEIGAKAMQNPDEIGAAALPYLRIVGHLVFAWFFARMAKIALERHGPGDAFYRAKLVTARFYYVRLLPETAMLVQQVRAGSACLLDLDAELF